MSNGQSWSESRFFVTSALYGFSPPTSQLGQNKESLLKRVTLDWIKSQSKKETNAEFSEFVSVNTRYGSDGFDGKVSFSDGSVLLIAILFIYEFKDIQSVNSRVTKKAYVAQAGKNYFLAIYFVENQDSFYRDLPSENYQVVRRGIDRAINGNNDFDRSFYFETYEVNFVDKSVL